MVTMFFPEQNVSMTGWPDSVSVEDHLTGDLVTIRISLYVFTGWTPRITSADPLPPPVPQPSSM